MIANSSLRNSASCRVATHRDLRALLVTTAALSALASAAQAQQAAQIDEVVVTSSRIVRDGYNAPTPMSVVSQEQLQTNAGANIATFVTSMPTFVSSPSAQSQRTLGGSGNAGISVLNLRGLSVLQAQRTLVLLDGRRITPSHQNGAVDVSLIPQQLVSRVDIVTGGASAVYGSDAVAGVVNFVLNKTFTGIAAEVSGGMTHYQDGKNIKAVLSAGTPFAGGRGHLLLSGEIVRDQGIPGASGDELDRRGGDYGAAGRDTKRNYALAAYGNIINPAYAPGNGQPQRYIGPYVSSAQAAPGGVIISGPLKGVAFGEGGAPYQQVYGAVSGNDMIGADYLQNRNWGDLSPKEGRETLFGRVSYDLTDSVNVYGQFSTVRASFVNHGAPQTQPGAANASNSGGIVIQRDNAYLPESVRARMVALNLTNFTLGTLGHDRGSVNTESDRRTTTFTVGATGELGLFGNPWSWDVYAQRGRSTSQIGQLNAYLRPRFVQAVDAVVNPATGAVVCRSTLTNPTNGCQPLNILGTGVSTANNPGELWVRGVPNSDGKISQDVFAASIAGDLFSVPAGPVSLALSAEYREDKSDIVVDADSLLGSHSTGNLPPLQGATNVKEAALETVVPITAADSVFGAFDINAAVRGTSYSYFGDVVTWKLGGTWDPIEDLTLRVTRSRDIRAPNHVEAFTAAGILQTTVFDPVANRAVPAIRTTVGNRDLVPEKADTLGIGAVVRPRFLPGFTASVDYWDIQLNGAIDSIGDADILLLCYSGARPELCAEVQRNAAGELVNVVQRVQNLAARKVRGVDYQASYRADLSFAPGAISLHFNATQYLRDIYESPIIVGFNNVGTIGAGGSAGSPGGPAKWRYSGQVSYQLDALTTSLAIRGHSGGIINRNYVECTSACPASTLLATTVNTNRAPPIFYLDFALSYKFEVGGHQATAFLNIRNLENKPHPAIGQIPTAYDIEGRIYRAGLRLAL